VTGAGAATERVGGDGMHGKGQGLTTELWSSSE
jgi:hypothetical protein